MSSRHARIWFNKGLSNIYDAVRLIREADFAGELTLLASHTDPDVPVMAAADEAWLEPAGVVPDEEYVEWCLDQCRGRDVQLLIPGRRRDILAAHASRFEALGTRLVATASAEVLDLLEKKDLFYQELSETDIPVAECRPFHDLAEFEGAYAELSVRHPKLCVKPATGMFGVGFRILEPEGDEFDLLLMDTKSRCSLETFRRTLSGTQRRRKLLLMQYLEGEERSVDCLAQDGELVAAVCRFKRGSYQVIEGAGPALELARAVTRRYRLNGVYNVQTKDSGGRTYLLEINSRMSGGLLYACLAGTCLPYWNILLALGWESPEAVPQPQAGIRVAPVQGAILLPEGTVSAEGPHQLVMAQPHA